MVSASRKKRLRLSGSLQFFFLDSLEGNVAVQLLVAGHADDTQSAAFVHSQSREPIGWLAQGRNGERPSEPGGQFVGIRRILLAKRLDREPSVFPQSLTLVEDSLPLPLKVDAAVLVFGLDQVDDGRAIVGLLAAQSSQVFGGPGFLALIPAQFQINLRQVDRSHPACGRAMREVGEVMVEIDASVPLALEPQGKRRAATSSRPSPSANASSQAFIGCLHMMPVDSCPARVHSAHRSYRSNDLVMKAIEKSIRCTSE